MILSLIQEEWQLPQTNRERAGGAPNQLEEPQSKMWGKLELKSLLLNNIDNKGFGIPNVDRESKRLWAVTPSKNKIK